VHVFSFSKIDARVLSTHFVVVCIVVHHSLVPPIVQFDACGVYSQFQYV
jgi:hypothetical protein